MTVRWFDLPQNDWVSLQANLRRVAQEANAALALGATNTTISTSVTVALTRPYTLVLVDTGAGSVTLTLPPAAGVTGYRVDIKKQAAANTLTVDGHASETIDAALTLAWTTQYQSFSLVSTGSAWSIV